MTIYMHHSMELGMSILPHMIKWSVDVMDVDRVCPCFAYLQYPFQLVEFGRSKDVATKYANI